MQWIKRNLVFVICAAVALALMVVAVLFGASKYNEDKTMQEDLNQQVSEATRLYNAPAFPNQENIGIAKKEQQRLKKFKSELQELFSAAPTFPKMDDQAFKSFLVKTISDLTASAKSANVALPEKYSFTFSSQITKFQFTPGSIEPWLNQIADIKVILGTLFQAKINALDGLQRVAVSKDDTGSEMLASSILTNQMGTTFAPYLISFRGFSGDLAGVLENLSRSSNCIIVKSVSVLPSAVPLEGITYAPQRAYRQFASEAAPRNMAGAAGEAVLTGGKGGTPSRSYAPVVAPVAGMRPASTTAITVLAEKPLQVTMIVEVVRLSQTQ